MCSPPASPLAQHYDVFTMCWQALGCGGVGSSELKGLHGCRQKEKGVWLGSSSLTPQQHLSL